jgi:hypothetical protein
MLKVHTAKIRGTHLDDGKPIMGQLLVVTSTKEKIAASIVVKVEAIKHNDPSDGEVTISYDLELIFPDMGEVGYIMEDIHLVGEVESHQTRENRQAAADGREAVRFPPQMGQRSIPVMPLREKEAASAVIPD